SSLARSIAEIYLDDLMEDEEPSPPSEPSGDSGGDGWKHLGPDELEACAGDYFSAELGVTYRLSAGKGWLTPLIVERRELKQRLRPREGDVFRAPWGEVKLVRGDGGAVTGFVLDAGRANGIVFERKP
ncbi:MAG: hypothetical protein O7B99_15850, partial [Planctomycetota bacterium]|nr:hypothetical protein [Planctomycetota bacterium]